jgi:hypothetical protein
VAEPRKAGLLHSNQMVTEEGLTGQSLAGSFVGNEQQGKVQRCECDNLHMGASKIRWAVVCGS